jgi:hypothetical protein
MIVCPQYAQPVTTPSRTPCTVKNVLQPCTVKKVSDFPIPSRDVTYQTLHGREELNYSRPGRVWLVTSRLGTGNFITFFYSVAVAQANSDTLASSSLRRRNSKKSLSIDSSTHWNNAHGFRQHMHLLYLPYRFTDLNTNFNL